MVWLLPVALAGLAAVIGPLIVHLLRRQRARTLVVPTVRFIPTVDQSVVRVRMPTDVPLLVLRMAIVACAALALARPLFLTDARAAGWADRIARVVMVDVGNPDAAVAAHEAASAELQSATFSQRIDAVQPGSALRRASAWLADAPPARREIVVISDFRIGSLDESLIRDIPETIGVRFVPVRPAATEMREIAAGDVLGPDARFERQARIDATSTATTLIRRSAPLSGLRLLTAPEDEQDAARLMRVVSRAGAVAPSASEPIVVRFAGGERLPAQGKPTSDGWALPAARRLLRDADDANYPVTVAIGEDGALLVDVNARPGTLVAAEVLKAALDARQDRQRLAAQEIARIPSGTLEAWGRVPGPADTAAWQRSEESDGRWFWFGALVLLAVEGWMRRTRSSSATNREVDAHAA